MSLKDEAYKPDQMFGHLGSLVTGGGDPDQTNNLSNVNRGPIKRMWSANSDTMPLWISRRMEEMNQVPLNEQQFCAQSCSTKIHHFETGNQLLSRPRLAKRATNCINPEPILSKHRVCLCASSFVRSTVSISNRSMPWNSQTACFIICRR